MRETEILSIIPAISSPSNKVLDRLGNSNAIPEHGQRMKAFRSFKESIILFADADIHGKFRKIYWKTTLNNKEIQDMAGNKINI